jgi:hypothetical protein
VLVKGGNDEGQEIWTSDERDVVLSAEWRGSNIMRSDAREGAI